MPYEPGELFTFTIIPTENKNKKPPMFQYSNLVRLMTKKASTCIEVAGIRSQVSGALVKVGFFRGGDWGLGLS